MDSRHIIINKILLKFRLIQQGIQMSWHPISTIMAYKQDVAINVSLNIAYFIHLLTLLVSIRDRHK